MADASGSAALKAIASALGTSFIIATVFWAGATYQRVSAIEIHLSSIDVQLSKLADLSSISERTIENSRRIQKLEDK